MFNSQGIVPDTDTRVVVRRTDGSDPITTLALDDTGGGVSIHLNSERFATDLLVAAEQAHDHVVDTEPARTVAEEVAVALHERGIVTSALDALAENGVPSILVDGAEGRSFVLHVREV